MNKADISLLSILSLAFLMSSCKEQSSYNGHEYVDLGLSVKWATCNVGAQNPEDYGDYFGWGEVNPKDSYTWENYRYYASGHYDSVDDGLLFSKYTFEESFGKTDKKNILEQMDDAANNQWGGNWRIPTKDEFEELRTNCTWVWSNVNGVNGYKITSNKIGYTDNSIFLPAAGRRFDTTLSMDGNLGQYWSKNLKTDFDYIENQAWDFEFHNNNDMQEYWSFRYIGLPIRPVWDPNM